MSTILHTPRGGVSNLWRHNLPSGEDFGWHWITITGLREGPDGKKELVVSSWGSRFFLDWDAYWDACRKPLLRGGFVCFE